MLLTYEEYQLPITPLREIKFILDDVEYLNEMCILNEDKAAALTALLEAGIKQLNQKNVHGANIWLRAFVGEVNTQIKEGILSKADGEALTDSATSAITYTQ